MQFPSRENSTTWAFATGPSRIGGAGSARVASSAGSSKSEPNAQQLSQRIAHLEADVAHLTQRKAQLEKENETLAAAARRPDLEARLSEALATSARLRMEHCQSLAESDRRAELERQQTEIAQSFTELQAVVSQLVKRLNDLDAQRAHLQREKSDAEAGAMQLRKELATLSGFTDTVRAGRYVVGRSGVAVHEQQRTIGATATAVGERPQRVRVDGATQGMAQRESVKMTLAKVELVEAKIERELLRQRLIAEEAACAQARRRSGVMERESSHAEAKCAELRSELCRFVGEWPVPTDDQGAPSLSG